MLKKWKGLLFLIIGITALCTAMPVKSFADDNVASVSFGESTEYYATIDAAWEAAVALDTAEENKVTIKLLADCTAENTLTNTADYLVLDTNGKTLTTPDAIAHTNDILCGIRVEGGSLELTGNGTISGLSAADYGRAIVLMTGGKVSLSGITIHNTGISGSNSVLVNGGEFYLFDGYIHAEGEYALNINRGNVYLYSGKIEGDGRMAMCVDYYSSVRICYSDKPLYFIDHDVDNNWYTISGASYIQLEDNVVVDLEYSDNPDGSDSKILKSTTKIAAWTNTERNYLKIQTYKPSYLFSTNYNSQLLNKIKNDSVTDLTEDAFTAVHFVNLADYDLTDVTYSDYSAKGNGSVKAWVSGTELYIGGEGRIIAGNSLANAFRDGENINSITGLDLLGTSNVTDMSYLFYNCGSESAEFKLDLGNGFDTSSVADMTYMFCNTGRKSTAFALDLGDNFDTSNVTNMSLMFVRCGYSAPTFTLDLGDKFNTSKVNDMYQMFEYCGYNSTAFKTLDLSTFTVSAYTRLDGFAESIPVTKFIFGKGWRNAALPTQYTYFAKRSSNTPTEIVGATKNLLSYDWTRDNRTVTFTDNITYTITPVAEDGGTVSGGGTVPDGGSITLTAKADNGYVFKGWYEEYKKVCETEEFVIEDADDDRTYTATFAEIVYYTITAEVGADGGGTVSGGGTVLDGGSVTLTATAGEGYTFDGWYDGDTKVCETEEFVVNNVTADKTYTAKFTENLVTESYLFSTSSGSTLLTKIKNDGVTEYIYNKITGVHFVDLADYDLTNITYSDYSANGDGSVKAWMDGTELYIGGNGKIMAGESLGYAFANGSRIDSITGFEMLDTSGTKNMSHMFDLCGSKSDKFTLDLGNNFDTSNVTDMSYMFDECGGDIDGENTVFTIDLGDKFDTSNVTDMTYMFYSCGRYSTVFTLDLGDKFDTAKVTDMSSMFAFCGSHSTAFTLDLGDRFNTSNVTNMVKMFYDCGYNSPNFTLNLGGNFDTSNVTNMVYMFGSCGSYSTVLTLDLGDKFNTSNVTDMSKMFYDCGCGSKVFTLDLGDKFDTSKVTGMSGMFQKCGYSSTVFTLDLGDKFNTSNVTNMSNMFNDCGYSSTVFTLNLGNLFDTSKVTDMSRMFADCGYGSKVFTLDLGDKFDTSKVKNMTSMFSRCGYGCTVFTLDLGDKFDTSNVTNMSLMFDLCGYYSTVFTLNLGNLFDTSKVTDMSFMFRKCGYSSEVFTLDLGDKFDTSNVKHMEYMFNSCGYSGNAFTLDFGNSFDTSKAAYMGKMFQYCGMNSTAFTTLDLSAFTVNADADISNFAQYTPITTFIFGEGWANASLPEPGSKAGAFYTLNKTDTTIVGAPENLLNYDWASDNRNVDGLKPKTYTVTATVETGGTVSGGGEVAEGESITLTATANDGYTFAGWYDGDTKVCDTAEFVIENVTADKTYTAKFTKNAVSYTISAEVDANGGGSVTGGGKVAEGESITLTATAGDGYTFAGWYDGDTKVCDMAEFVIENVTADKTYTAKFTKSSVEPDPEPEEPEVPYLTWNGSALKLVKKSGTSCRVGIVYVGGATFDADNINWDKLVAAGKEYTDLNSSVGYAVYANFTKRTPGTRGNYVAFVKYTKEDGTTTADYITFTVKDAVSFEVPTLSYNIKTKTLKLIGDVSSTVGVAYVGDASLKAGNITWNDFIKAGKQYPDVNGSNGYAKVLDTRDYTKTFDTDGNYVAFIKYFDENLNKTLAKYYTFTVEDYDTQPTDAPFAVASGSKITLDANGFDVAKVTIAYIGTEDVYISGWSDFSAAAAAFSDINGKYLNQQYTNPKDGSSWKQTNAGWYAVYVRYTKDGKTCSAYYTVELN